MWHANNWLCKNNSKLQAAEACSAKFLENARFPSLAYEVAQGAGNNLLQPRGHPSRTKKLHARCLNKLWIQQTSKTIKKKQLLDPTRILVLKSNLWCCGANGELETWDFSISDSPRTVIYPVKQSSVCRSKVPPVEASPGLSLHLWKLPHLAPGALTFFKVESVT